MATMLNAKLVELDVVRTLVDRKGVPAGTEGTLVAIHGEGPGCEVEFRNSANCSADLVTYTLDELELSIPYPPVAIRISSEFLRGPVWTIDRRDGCPAEDLPLVHGDPVVKALDEELGDMYSCGEGRGCHSGVSCRRPPRRPGYRKVPETGYFVLFRVEDGVVQVARIFYRRQDYARLL